MCTQLAEQEPTHSPSRPPNNRFSDEDGEADPSLGPVRRSQGADLADLLERTEPHDLGLYYHARSAPAAPDWGPPPGDAAASYQVGRSGSWSGLLSCPLRQTCNEPIASA